MSIKILLADDSITIQKVVGIIFGGEDYSLTVVDNGKAAVEKARELDPDVLLIDALMPGMSGYEVCEAVRSTPALSNKPILLLTGSFEPFDENKAKSCGADDFIAKPFESQQIIAKVKELFELGKGRSSTPAEVPQQAPEQVAPPAIETPQEAPSDFTEPEAAPFQTTSFKEETPSPFESTPFESTSFESTSFAAESPAPSMPATATATAAAAAAATAAPAIWDAFTPEESVVINPEPTQETYPAMSSDDVFAMVQEEPETIAVQPTAQEQSNPHIDSQWIPVEEQSFEFAEEKIAELPPTVFDEPAPLTEKTAFDTSAFESSNTPVFEQTPSFGELPAAAFDKPLAAPAEVAQEAESPFETSYQSAIESAAEQATATNIEALAAVPVIPAAMAATAAFAPTDIAQPSAAPVTEATAALTEEQLKAALASLSKDVIERIVWEVVPDLAEVLIKEAIRKIKEGI